MSIPPSERLRHLMPSGTAESRNFVQRNRGGRPASYPSRNPDIHGQALSKALESVAQQTMAVREQRADRDLGEVTGSYVTFELTLNPDLPLDSLENRRVGIELMAFKTAEGGQGVATVFVPEGQLRVFEKKLEAYLDPTKAREDGRRRHEKLVNSVQQIRRTVLRDLWTDPARDFPSDHGAFWWELWLRKGLNLEHLREQAKRLGIAIGSKALLFPDRTVVLAHATVAQMVLSVDLLDALAEVRSAQSLACELLERSTREDAEALATLRRRLKAPPSDAPAVCVLDTGVDQGHPLLETALPPENVHSYNPDSWGSNDRHGHGTEMAGFALFGDRLEELLLSDEPVEIRHQLESVKILRAPGTNPPELYGEITRASAARVEIQNPYRRRTFSLSVSDPETRSHAGQPTSWSAALDLLCSGAEEESPSRLMFVSSGNAVCEEGYIYPDANHTDCIHDPAQAWNALTIGAYTEKDLVHEADLRDWEVVAPAGGMSPCNSTSLTWTREWPNKPDLVLEGGNMAWDPSRRIPDALESLQLLTTKRRVDSRLLCRAGDTSAATACGARMGALLYAEYPDLWPETVRALLVHSARWTRAMESSFPNTMGRRRIENLLRCYGWGVPNLDRAMYSLRNHATLIVQEVIQPFRIEKGEAKSNEMHFHRLPWPSGLLNLLAEAEVRMRVTLSYFIEPKPGQRGVSRRHRYASHGLRFEVKTATEREGEFLARINRADQEEASGASGGSSDSNAWQIGPQERSRGSVHSDTWAGSGADLASKDAIAVYPTLGWWRDPKQRDRCERQVRYALIVSIESDETAVEVEGAQVPVDFYSEIINRIEISGQVEIPTHLK